MNNKWIIGLVFVALGLFLVTEKASALDDIFVLNPGDVFANFWPTLFVIPIGIVFHIVYFMSSRRGLTGILIPGGILLCSGIIMQIATLFDNWDAMWPGFPFAVALGLLEFYMFGNRNKWLLIPIFILGSISVIFFSIFSFGTFFSLHAGRVAMAILLILIGVLIIFGKRKRGDSF